VVVAAVTDQVHGAKRTLWGWRGIE
jgi:hypothetical protein